MNAASSIIAVPEGAPSAGAIVWWRLSGGVLVDDLEEAWEDAGLDLAQLPAPPTNITALRRAILEQRTERRLVRKLADGSGYAIVDERAKGRDLDYSVDLRVTLKEGGGLEFAPEPGDDVQAAALAQSILTSFRAHTCELSTADVGGWLVRRLEECDGIRLRDTGGIYFIPHTTIDRWRKVAEAVREASEHVIFEVPALRNDTAVEAILDAISQEALAAADRIAEEMEKEDLGARALSNRAERCAEMREKLKRYEGLLGRSLEVFSERLDDLGAQLTVAALKAQSKSEKESA